MRILETIFGRCVGQALHLGTPSMPITPHLVLHFPEASSPGARIMTRTIALYSSIISGRENGKSAF